MNSEVAKEQSIYHLCFSLILIYKKIVIHAFVYIFTEFEKNSNPQNLYWLLLYRLFQINSFCYRCNCYWIFDCLRKIARLTQLCRYLVAWKTRFECQPFGYQCRCHGILFVLTRFCFWAWMLRNHHHLVCSYG